MNHRLAVIGTGTMGGAIVAGLLGAGWAPHDIVCTVRSRQRADDLAERFGVETSLANDAAVSGATMVLIALKPQALVDELARFAQAIAPGAIVVSIAAGITTAAIEAVVPSTAVIRAMPNTPLTVGRGITALTAGAHAGEQDLAAARELFSPVGEVVIVGEADMDAVTAVSGSGPAYVFRFVEAWIDAATAQGLDANVARQLVIQTLLGSATMLAAHGADPIALRSDVTSPGGTTAAGIAALDDADFAAAVAAAIDAARRRANELAG